MHRSDKRKEEFLNFLPSFIRELNEKCVNGAAVLVEGKRDVAALRRIGFKGNAITVTSFVREKRKGLQPAKELIILTDFDLEGRSLAARFMKIASRLGIVVSVWERRRLFAASNGLFYNIENLAQFAGLLGKLPSEALLD